MTVKVKLVKVQARSSNHLTVIEKTSSVSFPSSRKTYLYKLFFFSFLTIYLYHLPLSAKDVDLNTIVENAKNKTVLLFFHKPNCGYCDHMIEFTLKDGDIDREIKRNFVFVDLYTQESGTILFKDFKGSRKAFAKSLGYDFYPTTVFIDNKKNIINITPGLREQDDYMKVLLYISSKKYEEMEFETYIDTLDFDSDS